MTQRNYEILAVLIFLLGAFLAFYSFMTRVPNPILYPADMPTHA